MFDGKREMNSFLLWLYILLVLLCIRLNVCDVVKYVWHMKFELIWSDEKRLLFAENPTNPSKYGWEMKHSLPHITH